MSVKADWEPRLCPGGCGHVHRDCCDSVVMGEHQTSCRWVLEWVRGHGTLELELEELVDAER